MRFVPNGLILAGLVAVSLGAGATGITVAAAAQDQLVAPSETVTVVMTDMEPFVMADRPATEAPDPDGFCAEIWDAVADDLEVDYDVLWVGTFGDLLPAIDSGAAQIAIAPIAPTAEREANYDFSSAVISSGPQLGYHERGWCRWAMCSTRNSRRSGWHRGRRGANQSIRPWRGSRPPARSKRSPSAG